MFVRAKRQVFVSDKPETTSTKDKKRKNRRAKKKKGGEKVAMVALLVFILATFWSENKTA